jgi:hypothetical protein
VTPPPKGAHIIAEGRNPPQREIIDFVPKRDQPLDPYKRVRKPMPPPGRAIPDRRRKLEEDRRKREAEEAVEEAEEERKGP